MELLLIVGLLAVCSESTLYWVPSNVCGTGNTCGGGSVYQGFSGANAPTCADDCYPLGGAGVIAIRYDTGGSGFNTPGQCNCYTTCSGCQTSGTFWSYQYVSVACPASSPGCAANNYWSASNCGGQGANRFSNGCTACFTACTAGTGRTTSCTPTSQVVCNNCVIGSTWNDGTYLDCQACATCGVGFFQTTACTTSNNRACTACRVCLSSEYETSPCTSTSDRVCTPLPCTTLPPGVLNGVWTPCTLNVTSGNSCPLICDQGYYQVGNIFQCNSGVWQTANTPYCRALGEGCVALNSAGVLCTTCAAPLISSPTGIDNRCACIPGYFDANNDTSYVGLACVPYECPTAQCETNCAERPYEIPPYVCSCATPYYLGGDGKSCLAACNSMPQITSEYTTGNCVHATLAGASCTLGCAPQYTQVGSLTVDCDINGGANDGTGNWSAPTGYCAAPCDLSAWINAQSAYTTTSECVSNPLHEEQCSLACNQPNWLLTSPETPDSNLTITCKNGTLIRPTKACTPVCPAPVTDGFNAAVLHINAGTCNLNTPTSTVCQLGCDPTYAKTGSFAMTCQTDHTWSTLSTGICQAPCASLPAIADPFVVTSSCSLPKMHLESCTLSCNSSLNNVPIIANGSLQITCSGGFFNELSGHCVVGACVIPAAPTNGIDGSCGTLNNRILAHNQNCSMSCEAGYDISQPFWRCVNGHLSAAPVCTEISSASTSLPTAAVVGGVVGGSVFIIFLVLLGCIFTRRAATRHALKQVQHQHEPKEIAQNEITLEKVIGEGLSSMVYKALWHGTEVAAKVLKDQSGSEVNMKMFKSEVDINQRLPFHPRVINFVGACSRPPHLTILMRFMDCGSMEELFSSKQAFPINSSVPNAELHRNLRLVIQVAVDASAGLLHCHLNGLVHRDVRAANFLITVDNGEHRATVSDFGISRFLPAGETQDYSSRKEQLPLMWMAPEAIMNCVYSFKTDVYMFGMVLYELFCRCRPYGDLTVQEFAMLSPEILSQLRPVIPENTPAEVLDIMMSSWALDPAQRPDMQQINSMLSSLLRVIEATPQEVNVADKFGIGESAPVVPRQTSNYNSAYNEPQLQTSTSDTANSHLPVVTGESSHYAEAYSFVPTTTAQKQPKQTAFGQTSQDAVQRYQHKIQRGRTARAAALASFVDSAPASTTTTPQGTIVSVPNYYDTSLEMSSVSARS